MTRDDHAILDLLADLPPGTPAYLATVVDVVGSSYRKPGARLLLAGDGRRAGSISGGCLERDLARRAALLTRNGPTTAVYDTRGDEERPGGQFNTGCDGVVTLLVEPASAGLAASLESAGGTRLTVFDADGDVPLKVSDRCCPCDERLPATVADDLRRLPVDGRIATKRYRSAAGWSLGLLVERPAPSHRLHLYGSGRDLRPMIDFAHILKWPTSIINREPAVELRRLFPDAADVGEWHRDQPAAIPLPGPNDAAVIATHSYEDDRLLVPALLRSPSPYVGLIGPKRRVARLMAELHAAGALPPPDRLAALRTPAGLDLGGDDATAVALSIVSEIQATFQGCAGGPLREREGAVHPPHLREEVALP